MRGAEEHVWAVKSLNLVTETLKLSLLRVLAVDNLNTHIGCQLWLLEGWYSLREHRPLTGCAKTFQATTLNQNVLTF